VSAAGSNGHVLLVDDDRDLCLLVAAGLGQRGFKVTFRLSAAEGLDVLGETPVDVVLADVEMAGMNGFELCGHVVQSHPQVPVLLLTGHGTLAAATNAIRLGAADFFTKPPDLDALAIGIGRAVQRARLRGTVHRLRDVAPSDRGGDGIVGESPALRTLRDVIARVAPSEASVLVTGESGTGKELVARALHRRSRRAEAPFIAINCAAMPEALLESELFGHLRGAFTDARTARAGLFQQARGGTLFLDEVGELPMALQPKLLRVLQERRVRPVGGDVEVACDVRIVAATNRDLEQAVRERRFREDLYFRLNVIHLDAPALRARGEDVLLLAQHFIARCAEQSGKDVAGLSPAAAECLLTYGWPGNVRELQNCIERAVVFAAHSEIVVDDLPERVRDRRIGPETVPTRPPLVPLRELERIHVLRVLDAVAGNRTLAAQVLEVDRKTLFRKLKQWRAEGKAA
jgi:DNA-binding NtrC family response regulator